MRKFLTITALITSILAGSAAAAQAPDYIGNQEQFEAAARVLTSIGTCKGLGFTVDERPAVVNEITDRAVRDAVADGIGLQMSRSMLADKVARERQDLAFLATPPAGTDTDQERIDWYKETIRFWATRCAGIADEIYGSQYINHTTAENEAAVQQRSIDNIVAKLAAIRKSSK